MMTKADVVIIGGGINGAATAYNLAKLGIKDILVVERDTICGGSTGRCGAGIRAQWGTLMNCQIAANALSTFESLKDELGMDIGLNQCGYLMVAYKESEFEQLQKNVCLQNSCGIGSRVVTKQEAYEICPGLWAEDAVGFTFHSRDGHADPFLTTFAYVEAAKRLGVEFERFTEVQAINVTEGRVESVLTSKGTVWTKAVINCAGPYSQVVAKMAGVDLPVYSERHEILITEPVEPGVCPPMLMSFSGNYYIQQRPHGSIIGGCSPEGHPQDFANNVSWDFLGHMASVFTKLLPRTRNIRVVRQWAGMYNMTPDRQPLLGRTEVEGFFISCGYSGHGFMLAPFTGKLLAEMVAMGETSMDISMLDYRRFERGEMIVEPAVV